MIILLTGCINPNGMNFTTLNDIEERKKQYIEAINFYLSNTKYQIVFTENSGIDISPLFKDSIYSDRLEIISYNGNQNKELGKGYGEIEIIEYSLTHSKIYLSHPNQPIIKITGRLIVKNITLIYRIYYLFHNKQIVSFEFNSNLSFPDSRIIIARPDFYKELLLSKKLINDAKGYFFENAVKDIITKNKNYTYLPFLVKPRIIGMSGTTGLSYTDNPNSIYFTYKYFKYSIFILKKFHKIYR